MYKILGVSLIFIFLPVCASFSAPSQLQNFLVSSENSALLAGGPLGGIQNTNLALVSQNQNTSDRYSLTKALQFENAILIQGAYAAGMDGAFGVGQVANALGGQLQTIGSGIGVQNQIFDALFTQEAVKSGGIGAALGIQALIGVQVQVIVSPKGANTNVQYLGIGQTDSAAGP